MKQIFGIYVAYIAFICKPRPYLFKKSKNTRFKSWEIVHFQYVAIAKTLEHEMNFIGFKTPLNALANDTAAELIKVDERMS